MSSVQEPLIIKDFDQAMADSPHKGFGLFRNADIDSFPGAVRVGKKPGTLFHLITEQTFTADAGTDVCTTVSDVEGNAQNFGGAAVYFTTTDTLPAGLAINTIYFLIKVTTKTFQVAASYKNSVGSASGTEIDITDTGTGVHTMHQVPIGTIKHIVEDTRANNKYMVCSKGRIWFIPSNTRAYLLHNSAIDTGSSSVTNANGDGLAITPFSSTTSTFLFVFRNALIDVIDVYDSTAIEALAWANGWASLNSAAGSSNSHEAIEAQDAAIYFCDDRYVGSIIEKVDEVFVPGATESGNETCTYNNQALDLPPREKAECLEELGTNLLIGGDTFNKIYPWNRISDSFTLPIAVPETGIKKMKNIGGTVYILAGTWGDIYITQGSYVKNFKKIPTYAAGNTHIISSNPITWGGIAGVNGSLLVGVSGAGGNSGVWRVWPDGRLSVDNTPSTGQTNATAIWAKDEFYIMGYAGGADSFNSVQYGSILYTSLETVVQSPLYKVATKVGKATYSHIEVVLANPATDGNIKISYRKDLTSSFVEIDSYAADSSTYIFSTPDIGLIDLDNIQIQVEMNDGAIGVVQMELAEVRLYP